MPAPSSLFRTLSGWSDFIKLPTPSSRCLLRWPRWRWRRGRIAAGPAGANFCSSSRPWFFARTCALAFNRIADQEFDRENPRTAARHLPTGRISPAAAWALCLFGAAGLVGASWLLNDICCALSPVALFLVCFYSLTKRFTDFSHVFLGIALALAPLGAWLAVKGNFHFFPDGLATLENSAILPLLLAVAVVFWLIGFDVIYALQDYEFDRRRGLHSLVVRWGVDNALSAAFLSHMVMWMFLMSFGLLARFRLAYYVGLVLILGCLLLEHWLARRRSLNWIHHAFSASTP